MSQYENYDVTSRHYDSIRHAAGDDVIAAMIQFHGGKPLQVVDMLDAGCGTGNYSRSMLKFGVGSVTLIDASSGMLGQAKLKLADDIASGKVKQVVQTMMPAIPFENSSFDAIMFNMVLHHLEKDPDGINYPKIEETLIEARRVLKPGGVLALSCVVPDGEYFEKVWYYQLNHDITDRHKKQYPHMTTWKEMLNTAGFRFVNAMDVHVPTAGDKLVMDMEGPGRKEYRDGDSFWASATPDETEDVEQKIKTMKRDGTLEEFFKNANKLNDHFTFTFIFAVSCN